MPDRDLPINTREILYTALTRSRKSAVMIEAARSRIGDQEGQSREIPASSRAEKRPVLNQFVPLNTRGALTPAVLPRRLLPAADLGKRWRATPNQAAVSTTVATPTTPIDRSLGGCMPIAISTRRAGYTEQGQRAIPASQVPGAHCRPRSAVCPVLRCRWHHVRNVEKNGANGGDRRVHRGRGS